MKLGFQDLANWLRSDVSSPLDEKAFEEACQRRLVRALQLAQTSRSGGYSISGPSRAAMGNGKSGGGLSYSEVAKACAFS